MPVISQFYRLLAVSQQRFCLVCIPGCRWAGLIGCLGTVFGSQPLHMRGWPFLLLTLLLAGCGSAVGGRVISPEGDESDFAWTADEIAKPIAVRHRHATAETSVSLIRLAGAEQPHLHKDHDLVVVLLRGSARLHLGERVIDVHPGDVIEIPRGVVHWAENTARSASDVYAIFSPPFDGQDYLPVPSVKLITP